MTDDDNMTDDQIRAFLETLAGEGGGILGKRGEDYGNPQFNLKIYERLNRIVVLACIEREGAGYEPLPDGAEGSVSMLMVKASRVLTGPKIKRDTLLDLIGYTATLTWCWLKGGGKGK